MSPFVGMSFFQTQHERQDPSHSKNKKEINKMPKRISHEEHNKRLNLWGKGYSDKKIARECNVSSQAIEQWRKKHDIPANYKMFDIRNNKFI